MGEDDEKGNMTMERRPEQGSVKWCIVADRCECLCRSSDMVSGSKCDREAPTVTKSKRTDKSVTTTAGKEHKRRSRWLHKREGTQGTSAGSQDRDGRWMEMDGGQ